MSVISQINKNTTFTNFSVLPAQVQNRAGQGYQIPSSYLAREDKSTKNVPATTEPTI
jgi:hypothetical protein